MGKRCSRCAKVKPIKAFKIRRDRGTGRYSWCYACQLTHARNVYTPRYRKNRHLIKTYGITIEQYDEMLAQQQHKCAIPSCSEPLLNDANTHLDHCHKTGKVRGILCRKCNTAIGMIRESKEIAFDIVKYLGL